MEHASRSLLPFSYDILPPTSIRLLTPVSFPAFEGYVWRLDTVSLDHPNLKFDALSYTWGSQAQTYPIICNEQLLHVHYNLCTALPHLSRRRGDNPVLPIWIDAVCINQNNVGEKMAQIQLMNKIYRRAEVVWVWLGLAQHQDQIPHAIELLPLIIEAGTYGETNLRPIWEEIMQENVHLRGIDATVWSAVLHLVDNNWFRRIWIIQEAALARTITFLCGDEQVASIDIMRATGAAMHLYGIVDAQGAGVPLGGAIAGSDVFRVRHLVHSRADLQHSNGGREVILKVSNLIAGRHTCSQPQDRVIGILGLIEDEELSVYDMSALLSCTSLRDLYTRFSRFLLTDMVVDSEAWYEYFELALFSPRSQNLPSWVPELHDLDSPTFASSLSVRRCTERQGKHAYRASSQKGKVARRGAQLDQLVLQGKLVDEVVTVYAEIPTSPIKRLEDVASVNTAQLVQHELDIAIWEEKLARLAMHGQSEGDMAVSAVGFDCQTVTLGTYWETLCWDSEAAGDEEVARGEYREFRDYVKLFRDTMTEYDVIDKYAAAHTAFSGAC